MKMIKFDLLLQNKKIKNLEELQEHFCIDILPLFQSGRLTKWLRSRELINLVDVIEGIDKSSSELDQLVAICQALDLDDDRDVLQFMLDDRVVMQSKHQQVAQNTDVEPDDEQKAETATPAIDWSGQDMSNRHFVGADLRNANLTNANLSGSDFSGANLGGANLSGADLSNTSFSDANLSCVDLSGADIYSTDFSNAKLDAANLNSVNLNKSRATTTIWGNKYTGNDDAGANFTGADLTKATLNSAYLIFAIFNKANLADASFDHSFLKYAKFENANLRNTNFSFADMEDVYIDKKQMTMNCSFMGAANFKNPLSEKKQINVVVRIAK